MISDHMISHDDVLSSDSLPCHLFENFNQIGPSLEDVCKTKVGFASINIAIAISVRPELFIYM